MNQFLLPKKSFEDNLKFFFQVTERWPKEKRLKALRLISKGLYKNNTFVASNELLTQIFEFPYPNKFFSRILKDSGHPIKIINPNEILRIKRFHTLKNYLKNLFVNIRTE